MKKLFIAIVIVFLLAGVISGGFNICDNISKNTLKKVSVKKLPEGSFQLLVGDKPYFVQGVVYSPMPIGQDHYYNFWGDAKKPWLVDGRLMKAMGVNTIRFYEPGKNPQEVKKVMRDLYKHFGIRTVLGHYLKFWDYPSANYSDFYTQKKIREEVIEMVKAYKDEPALLFWTLGNENNYSFDQDVNPWSNEELERIENPNTKRLAKARIYYTFINDLAKTIHQLDSNHPVAMGNGELASLEVANEVCDGIDIFGGIVYRGKTFGSFFRQLKSKFNKPNCFLEFGCDSYNAYTKREDQDNQAQYLKSQWQDIAKNASSKIGTGNSLGGFVFEWEDEWWKAADQYKEGWKVHDITGGWSNPAYYDSKVDYNMNEEWWGVVSISPEIKNGVNKRTPRKAYYTLKDLWRK